MKILFKNMFRYRVCQVAVMTKYKAREEITIDQAYDMFRFDGARVIYKISFYEYVKTLKNYRGYRII